MLGISHCRFHCLNRMDSRLRKTCCERFPDFVTKTFFSEDQIPPHRSCSIDSLEKRLLLARGNAATPCDCLECRKNREEAIPHEKRNLRLVSEISISMLLEMLYIYASRNAIYLCFSKCFSKRRLSLIEKTDCSLKSTKMSAHGIQTFPWEERPCRKSASTESMAAQLKAKLATQ